MIVDINGVPHYFWRGKLYPGGVTPPPDPSDGAPRVTAERVGGGCETSHFLTSPLSAEQQHLNMINHLKGLHGTRGH